MYTIRINDDGQVMEYTTESFMNAIRLFEALKDRKVFSKIQVFNPQNVLKLETV